MPSENPKPLNLIPCSKALNPLSQKWILHFRLNSIEVLQLTGVYRNAEGITFNTVKNTVLVEQAA